jgi:hypothetical protein
MTEIYDSTAAVNPSTTRRPARYKKGLPKERLGDLGRRTKDGWRLYMRWCNIKQRCFNPKNSQYRHYGGRGITMCERWSMSYLSFIADMGVPPSSGHSIERVNADGNYEPSNCIWATIDIQARNKPAHNRYVEINGERMVFVDALKKHGHPDVNNALLWARLRGGWSFSSALLLPPSPNTYFPFRDRTMSRKVRR